MRRLCHRKPCLIECFSMDDATSPALSVATAPADSDLLSCLLNYIPDRIYFKDKSGRFLRVSGAEAHYLGESSTLGVIGKSDFDYFDAELAQAAFNDEQRVMQTGEAIPGQVERKRLLDGRTGWALVAKIPLRDAAGAVIGTCGISKDITEIKLIEEALNSANADLEAQKLRLEQTLGDLKKAHEELKAAQQQMIEFEKAKSIARLAYGVAHEIRNPLGTLEMGITFLTHQLESSPATQAGEVLQEMSKAIQRADEVICTLMDGASSSGVEISATDVPVIVEKSVQLMKAPHSLPK